MLQGCHSAGLQQAVGLGSSIIGGGQEQEWLTVVQAAARVLRGAVVGAMPAMCRGLLLIDGL